MRVDSTAFAEKNKLVYKEPRYTIEISFDAANTDLQYFTSHSDAATPAAVSVIHGVIENVSVTSQSIKPEKAIAEIGSISFTLVDSANQVRTVQANKLALGSSLKFKRVRVYMGYKDLAWSDYSLIQTQFIDDVDYASGIYTFNCSDVQRLERKEIFDLARTTLATSLTSSAATVTVYDTSGFVAVQHGTSWSDAPGQTVYYFKIENEVIRATGKTATTFTGCTRGALNTKAVTHTVDATASADRRTGVDEYVYLELPVPKMAYALLTGILHGDSATLPTSWHLGIDTNYVQLSDFTGIGEDLWDTADDTLGVIARFEGEEKQDGKKFIEEQLNLMIACFNPIYSSGELGLKRMSHVISDAAHVLELDETNLVKIGSLSHDMGSVKNYLKFLWNYEPTKKKYTRRNELLDGTSLNVYGKSAPFTISFRGVHGSVHTSKTIEQIFDSLRDRFSAPPMLLEVEILFSQNDIEVGDIVKLNTEHLQDYNTDGTIDRAFEVQRIAVDWVKGTVRLALFGSAARPNTIVRSDTTIVLSDAFYIAEGNNLKTYVGGGYDAGVDYAANHIVDDCQLTGGGDLTNASHIFYHDGDLTVDVGVTMTLTENVQLRVKGFLTVNGTIDGKGLAGVSASFSGFVGTAQAQGGFRMHAYDAGAPFDWVMHSLKQTTYKGLHSTAPELNLVYDSTTEKLNGLPIDLRGTRGDVGGDFQLSDDTVLASGGISGTSGSGLLLISRGLGFGVTGKIDLGGNNGASGTSANSPNIILGAAYSMASGGGAGGGAGTLYVILDGSNAIATIDNSELILCGGITPTVYARLPGAGRYFYKDWRNKSSYYRGFSGGCFFESQHRVQYIPSPVTAEEDATAGVLTAPTSLVAASGTDELLLEPDGTIVPRVKLTWVAAVDPDIAGYKVQYKPSADSTWINSTDVLGAESIETYVLGVTSGTDYDFRIQSAAGNATTSEWLTITSHTVSGKSEPPSDVVRFNVYTNGISVIFKWDQIIDDDLAGYEIRYVQQGSANPWGDGTPLTQTTRGTNVTSADIPDGDWTFTIKAVDTSGNYSVNAASADLTVTSDYDVVFGAEEAPAWNGTLTNLIKTFDNKLIPNGQAAVSTFSDWADFDQAVPDPYADCYYEIAAPIDVLFDSVIRVWSSIQSILHPAESVGLADPELEIDYRLDAGAYAGFNLWSIGIIEARYIKMRLHIDTSIGIPVIISMQNIVDAIERTETGTTTVGTSGTVIAFATEFHLPPFVEVQVQGATALLPTRELINTADFKAHVFDITGAEVGGTVDWSATGV